MKKFLFLAVLLTSCSTSEVKEVNLIQVDTIKTETTLTVDSSETASDSMTLKITNLLVNTEHADKKVKEIKAMKQENTTLKKELIETKEELQKLQESVDTTSTPKKARKTFLQKVISTIKKDTIE